MLARLKARVDLEAAARYVLSKRGSDGGYLSYQFMDMFESSAEDTYYALYSLRLLGVEPPRAAETVEFLRRLQREDGGYSSVEVAYFSIAALGLLGASPRDPSGAAEFLERFLAASAEAAAAVFPSFEEEQQVSVNLQGRHPIETLGAAVDADALPLLYDQRARVHLDPSVRAYAVRLVRATREHPDLTLGASPRGTLALVAAAQAVAAMAGRDYVLPDDVQRVAAPVLAHRLIVRPESLLRGRAAAAILAGIMSSVDVPLAVQT